ncbi:hypothetical protein NIA73_05925 [Anaerobutyricum hallii]|nr:hypothetical protein [Anaerobutyricum hallii]
MNWKKNFWGRSGEGQERINLPGRMEMHHREGLLLQFEVTDYEEEKTISVIKKYIHKKYFDNIFIN